MIGAKSSTAGSQGECWKSAIVNRKGGDICEGTVILTDSGEHFERPFAFKIVLSGKVDGRKVVEETRRRRRGVMSGTGVIIRPKLSGF